MALVFDRKKNGGILKFRRTVKERDISLRYFVYAKYNGLELREVRGKNIVLDDDSGKENGILDLRSNNIYDAGELRPHTKARDIEIVERPGTGERYIAIKFQGRENGKVEYVEYSPELYEMLCRPTYCNIGYNKHSDRATVVVHYKKSKNGYAFDNLAKFILLYQMFFSRYKNRTGGVKRFIHDYGDLRKPYSDNMDAAHINAVKWNQCKGNLLMMDEELNRAMSDNIKLFIGKYQVFTAVNERGEILIELINDGRTSYYKCATPERFLAWQNLFLGKSWGGKLQKVNYYTDDGPAYELTPGGMKKAGQISKEAKNENEPDIWEWLEHRDKLLSMDDSAFFEYCGGEGHTLIDAVNNVMALVRGVVRIGARENTVDIGLSEDP